MVPAQSSFQLLAIGKCIPHTLQVIFTFKKHSFAIYFCVMTQICVAKVPFFLKLQEISPFLRISQYFLRLFLHFS